MGDGMLIYVKMDIFESPAQVLVNTVNTVGVMGKGIAKQYKKLYPNMFKEYQYFCENGTLSIGKLWLYKSENKWILNFPTKKHWRNKSKIQYIEEGLQKFVSSFEEKGIRSISFPALGCGNGGLDWESEVKPIMEKYLKHLDIDVFIHLPEKRFENEIKEYKSTNEIKEWLNSEPVYLSGIEIWGDLVNAIDESDIYKIENKNYRIELEFIEFEGAKKITFINKEKVVILLKEDILEVWSILRSLGVLYSLVIPSHLTEKSKYIYKILFLLPYIGVSGFSRMENLVEHHEFGIRLLPTKIKNVAQEKWEL